MTSSLHSFIQCLRRSGSSLSSGVGLEPGVEEIADMIWLSEHLPGPEEFSIDEQEKVESVENSVELFTEEEEEAKDIPSEPAATHQGKLSERIVTHAREKATSSKPLMIPAAAALRRPLELARSLRALNIKVESRTHKVIDEEATAIAIAEKNPVRVISKPISERLLDLELIVEHSRIAKIWEQTSKEFAELLERLGAFRTIRTWTLRENSDYGQKTVPLLLRGLCSAEEKGNRVGKPKELTDASGRRLVMLLSDCISPLWRQGLLHEWLEEWGKFGPTVIIQWFPTAYWIRTGLKSGDEVWLSTLNPCASSSHLNHHYIGLNLEEWGDWDEDECQTKSFSIPVASLESKALSNWAHVIAGYGGAKVQGRRFELSLNNLKWRGPVQKPRKLPSSGVARLRLFLETASETAKELARLMSLGPVSPEITNLIQETLLPQSGTIHVAEVFLSGLLETTSSGSYSFIPGVRKYLTESALEIDKRLVFQALSKYISDRYNRTPREFQAFIERHRDWNEQQWSEVVEFAELRQQLYDVRAISDTRTNAPEFFSSEVERSEILDLVEFEFEMTKIISQEAGWTVLRERRTASQFIEHLGNQERLEMVKIEAGRFMMGSQEDEDGHIHNEHPQHEVSVGTFFISRYPITQLQWQVVSTMSQVNRRLEPNPSRFKGDDRPVEKVSWYEAIEFCDRLSRLTGRHYQLPSEAQWEYACRGGITTPFHFGETVLPQVANYDCSISYNHSKTGKHRKETTSINHFNVANPFGLHDVHGNVWEWCADHHHDDYNGAPTNGSVWISDKTNKRVIRGGSWYDFPSSCRSASRYALRADRRNHTTGLRICCVET